MAATPDADESKAVASHTLAYLRSLDRKLDLVIDVSQRQAERLARVDAISERQDAISERFDATSSR